MTNGVGGSGFYVSQQSQAFAADDQNGKPQRTSVRRYKLSPEEAVDWLKMSIDLLSEEGTRLENMIDIVKKERRIQKTWSFTKLIGKIRDLFIGVPKNRCTSSSIKEDFKTCLKDLMERRKGTLSKMESEKQKLAALIDAQKKNLADSHDDLPFLRILDDEVIL